MPDVSFDLAHFSDTHLGYEAYPALSPSGNNQRAADVVRAFQNVCEGIVAADVPLVLHTGDVTERPKVDIRYMLLAQQWFTRLAGLRPDCTRRQLVVIAGNHDLPRSRKEACWLELLRDIPGVHVVTARYEQITFDPARDGCDPALAGVVVHALPHDTLKEIDFDVVTPVAGRRNILMVHGVAGDSELFTRSLGREYHIPFDVLAREWDYVALGHFHKQGPVRFGGGDGPSRIWYAGSTENISFRDLKDNGMQRGWLHVTVRGGGDPDVRPVHCPIRPMFRLPALDVAGLAPDEITARLKAAVRAADTAGAVVSQLVTGVSRDIWSLVDVGSVRAAAADAVHYEIAVRYASAAPSGAGTVSSALGDLASVLAERAEAVLPDDVRDDALALARELLGAALTEPALGGDGDAAEPTTAAEEAA